MLHIQLAKNHDQIIVAPASANFISKLACGLASSLSLLSIAAANVPILIVPAMNPQVYKNKIFQKNLHSLKMCGFQVIEPDYGVTACGDEGFGRYPQIEKILNSIDFDSIKKQKLKGKKALTDKITDFTDTEIGNKFPSNAIAAKVDAYNKTFR